MEVKPNGSNGHDKRQYGTTIFLSEEDKGDREATVVLCAKRLDNGGWCVLPDGHVEDCDGPARRHGPEPSLWHQHHRGCKVICGRVIGPSTICEKQRGHGGKCD